MRKETRNKLSIVLAVLLAAVLVLAIVTVAGAASVAPVYHSGNTPGGCDLKIDPPSSGTYAIPGHPGMVIDVTISGGSVSFSSDVYVTKVYVKGGPGYNEYNYGTSGVLSDSGLSTPNNSGGQPPKVSHVCFFFGSAPSTTTTTEPTTTTVAEETSTTSTSESTTTTVAEETSTTVGQETTTTGGGTTVSEIQTGLGGSTGLGAGIWALAALALALAGGLGWTALRPAVKRSK